MKRLILILILLSLFSFPMVIGESIKINGTSDDDGYIHFDDGGFIEVNTVGIITYAGYEDGVASKYNKYRTNLRFNTSSIPDNGVIQEATLFISFAGATLSPDCYAMLSNISDWGTLGSEDWDVPEAITINSTWIHSNDSAGFKKQRVDSAINKYGMTVFRINTTHEPDAPDQPNCYMNFRTFDSVNLTQPYLIINYTTIPDITPPSTITNLTSPSQTNESIYWTFTIPLEGDYSHAEIHIDGVWVINLSSPTNYYNATGFLPLTNHTISIKTTDTSGNTNDTWVNHTTSTLESPAPPPPPTIFLECKISPEPIIGIGRQIPIMCRIDSPYDHNCVVSVYANNTLLSTSPKTSKIQGIGMVTSFKTEGGLLHGYYNQFMLRPEQNYSIVVKCGNDEYTGFIIPSHKGLTEIPGIAIWGRDNAGMAIGAILLSAMLVGGFIFLLLKLTGVTRK